LPEFAGLVDINLTGLLGIRLPKLLANLVSLNSLDENPTLGGEICSTVEAEIGCEIDLVRVKEMSVGVEFEINRSAFPIDFEGVGFVWKARNRRAVIWERAEVLVFSSDSLASVWSAISNNQWLGHSGWF
jgi:hypothetical protein